ncbi:MAG: hypothetical protein JWQ73_1265 [Variovorax sp.]|nr:hypothetical protein [Variovorax sp.]
MLVECQSVGKWQGLHARWHLADQIARKARSEVDMAARKCLQGIGVGPTMDQLEKASELERAADMLRAEMDLHFLGVMS